MLERFYRFWFEERHYATPLGLLRILFGVLMLISLAYDLPEVAYYYSTEGLIPEEHIHTLTNYARFSVLDYVQSPAGVYVVYMVFMAVMLLFTLGYKTKYVKFLQFILVLSFDERNPLILEQGLLRALSFYLMISPCGKALSIDSLSAGIKKIAGWHVLLIKMHVAGMYFFAGIEKLAYQSWIDGTAVNFILRNNIFNRVNMDWITAIPFVIFPLTWLSLLFQVSFPAAIWFERFRKPLLLAGLIMHLGIFIFLDVEWFSLTMLAAYAVFLKHEEICAAIWRIKKKYHKSWRFLSEKSGSLKKISRKFFL